MVRYSFLVRLSHPLLHAGFIPALSLITRSALASTFGGSLARPGGNVTGITNLSVELGGIRTLLRRVPALSLVRRTR